MPSQLYQREKKPRLLVTGASGLLGYALCRLAVERWSVFGHYCHHEVNIAGVVPVRADFTDPDALPAMVLKLRPRAVIHAAADSQVMRCESNPRRSQIINCHVPAHLARICAESGMDLLFTSTDLVFDGRRAPYDESAGVNPVCEYARQKAAAEKAVLNRHAKALVCRMPLMFGLALHARHHFTVQMLESIVTGRPLDLFVDEFRTPVDTVSAARGILMMIGKVSGLLHLGGRSRVSRYNLGLLMARQLKMPHTMLRPVAIGSTPLPVRRSPDCTLVSETAYDLGYDPLSLEEALGEVARRFLDERKVSEQGIAG